MKNELTLTFPEYVIKQHIRKHGGFLISADNGNIAYWKPEVSKEDESDDVWISYNTDCVIYHGILKKRIVELWRQYNTLLGNTSYEPLI